jgi:tRNA-uridine 2-sulfurtransferase
MSGGVDSAVAAVLLAEAGAQPIGLSLRLHDPDPCNPLAPRACCPPDDLQDARRVAELLDIPFYVIDARDAFDSAVVKPFVGAYLEGRTPNPCVGCNSFVKLARLARRAKQLGCAALATGHYARIDGGRLFTGADAEKDQSYFLFGTARSILEQLVFPVGAMTKAEVREKAMAAGLPVGHKLESQEVCFVGGAGAGKFVMRQAEAEGDHSGPILDTEGREIGRHEGVMHFTIGQRKGIGIGGARSPLHVLSIDAEEKSITVGSAEDLLKRGLFTARTCWTSGEPQSAVRARVRVRYRALGEDATVAPLDGDRAEVVFDHPVRAIAPGQAAVFYAGEEVIGGGWITGAIA